MRRISGVAPRVKPKKTSADPGGLTTGKIAASTRRNVLRGEFMQISEKRKHLLGQRQDFLDRKMARDDGDGYGEGSGETAAGQRGDERAWT